MIFHLFVSFRIDRCVVSTENKSLSPCFSHLACKITEVVTFNLWGFLEAMKPAHCAQAGCSYFSQSNHGIRTQMFSSPQEQRLEFYERICNGHSFICFPPMMTSLGKTTNVQHDKLFMRKRNNFWSWRTAFYPNRNIKGDTGLQTHNYFDSFRSRRKLFILMVRLT